MKSFIKNPCLANAEQLALDHPKTFKRPSAKEIHSIKVGDFVKVCCDKERFWSRVTRKKRDGMLEAICDNDLVLVAPDTLQCGDRFVLHSINIYDIIQSSELRPSHRNDLLRVV